MARPTRIPTPPPADRDDEDDILDPTLAAKQIAEAPAAAPADLATAETVALPRPGRPSLAEVAARPPAGDLKPVEMTHPHRIGIVCPGCGRTVDPRVLRTAGTERTVECTSCRRKYVVSYSHDGWPKSYRFIR